MKNEIEDVKMKGLFDDVRAALGNQVAISVVKERFPEMVGHIMRRGQRVDRGVYNISEEVVGAVKAATPKAKVAKVAQAVTPAFAEPELNTSKREIEVIDNFGDEVRVPEKNADYVAWGCYAAVSRVIMSSVFAPVYIVGASGNGKTMGVEQACAAKGRELVMINITNETTEEDLIGSYILVNGDMVWRDGPVIAAMRHGAVLCLDELDQARTSILALQTIAQGKPYFIKKTNELVRPARGFCLIGTANTKGDGIGSDNFAGAQILNEAFLERFNIVLEQEYPPESIEKRILARHSENTALINRLTRFAMLTRKAHKDGAITHCITTRRLVQICQNIEIFGNELTGVKFALARFNEEIRDNFYELYTKISTESGAELTADAQEPIPAF